MLLLWPKNNQPALVMRVLRTLKAASAQGGNTEEYNFEAIHAFHTYCFLATKTVAMEKTTVPTIALAPLSPSSKMEEHPVGACTIIFTQTLMKNRRG